MARPVLLNVPLALGAAVALPLSSTRAASAAARLDVRGSVLLSGVMLGVVAAATEAPRHAWLVVPAVAVALLCATCYVRHQRRGEPVLPLTLFRSPPMRLAVGALSAMFGAIFGIAFLMPQYLQTVRGVGPLGAGLFILAYAVALVASALVAGDVPARHRRRFVSGGLLIAAAVHATGLTPTTSGWVLAVGPPPHPVGSDLGHGEPVDEAPSLVGGVDHLVDQQEITLHRSVAPRRAPSR